MKNEASEENKIVKFVYRYSDHEGRYQEATINIRIPYEDECLQELVTELLSQMGVMMRYVDENVKITKALQQFIGVENQKARDEYAEKMFEKIYNNECDLEEIVRNTEKHYKEELIKFADRIGPTDENIFAQSFHRLVHSSFLEEILKRERAYAETISNMTKVMDKEVESLNNSQQEEMDLSINQLDITTTSEDINYLLAQQYSTQNFVRKRYESELEAKKGHQRNEYRDWIISQVNRLFQTSPVTTPLGNRSSMFISQQPSIEESFTIHLGSQLKHMHNIRILSANINDLCSPLYVDESLNGMNMALGVYSSSLCGVVVLTSQFQPYSNKDIIKNANMSTELHFDQIDNQFEKIEQQIRHINMNSASPTPSTLSVCTVSADYSIASGTDEISSGGNSVKSSANASPMKSNANLHTGDFFITKHSNLSQSHVIFHLISDEPLNSPSEINSRHPVILGLRNILKIASRHDVTMLTIPALLRHEMSEDMTVQWCIRRAELVFKCVKGFMIESASWGGAELSTLQLLLPHDISEELFSTLSSMVPNVFRLANPKILVDTHK